MNPRILALETSGTAGSVAAFLGEELLREVPLAAGQRSAQSLAPAIRALWAEVGWKPGDVQLIALPIGPGSFTGLRVGVMTAKTLAFALGAEVLGLNTLAVVAENAPAEIGELEVVLDAQRKQLYAQRFSRDAGGHFAPASELSIEEIEDWARSRAANLTVVGPGLEKAAHRLPADSRILDEALWVPRAAQVGHLAMRLYEAGQRDDVLGLAPRYYRRSAAEEKRDSALSGGTSDR